MDIIRYVKSKIVNEYVIDATKENILLTHNNLIGHIIIYQPNSNPGILVF
jgi:hypothetical protein